MIHINKGQYTSAANGQVSGKGVVKAISQIIKAEPGASDCAIDADCTVGELFAAYGFFAIQSITGPDSNVGGDES